LKSREGESGLACLIKNGSRPKKICSGKREDFSGAARRTYYSVLRTSLNSRQYVET